MSAPELLVVALEASADLHGAAVLRELRALRPGLRVFGAGGPRMRQEGLEALVRAEDISVMGIAEVIPALPRILDAMDVLYDAARERRPRAALLIDSPDFNLRLARRLRMHRVPVAYFIGPSVWAWRTGRVRQIARDVARMLVILPFEAPFYEAHHVPAVYVGNPLADGLRPPVPDRALNGVLALLPGSRPQEIRRMWPSMLEAARRLKARRRSLQLIVPVAPTIDRALLGTSRDVELVDGDAPQVLARAYRTSWLTWWIGRMLVRVKFISLVNLICGRAAVPELLQAECTPDRMTSALEPLLSRTPERAAQLEALNEVRAALAPQGSMRAARRAAEEVLGLLESSPP